MNILYIADVPNWAFHKNGLALQKYGKNKYTIKFRGKSKYKSAFKGCSKYDLILYCVDVRPDYLLRYGPPKNKTIMLIRSDIFKLCDKGRNKFYKDPDLTNRYAKCFFVSNKAIQKKLEEIHYIKCYYTPGGVDTALFRPPSQIHFSHVPRVGWAGSKMNKGRRGIFLIEQACKDLGYDWCPAYREEKWRSQDDMVNYYWNDIDIYIDCDNAPGRQNGLLEAGACGVPLVSTPYGIAPELIESHCCVEVDRTIRSIKEGLRQAWKQRISLSENAYNTIRKEWNWKRHVYKWEKIFNEII